MEAAKSYAILFFGSIGVIFVLSFINDILVIFGTELFIVCGYGILIALGIMLVIDIFRVISDERTSSRLRKEKEIREIHRKIRDNLDGMD